MIDFLPALSLPQAPLAADKKPEGETTARAELKRRSWGSASGPLYAGKGASSMR
jgi:hypothetical protein